MMAANKKQRTEWIYGTTAGEVTEIGMEVSADGQSICFSQDMINTYAQATYPREGKTPKVTARVPISDLDIPFSLNSAVGSYDRLVAVDTGHKIIRGESVSVTGIVEGEWNWEAGPHGLVRAVRPKAAFVLEFLGVEESYEQLGWIVALQELMKEPSYQQSSSVGLIVDSDLENHVAYNARCLPVYRGRYLPEKVTMLYAFDRGKDCVGNFLLRLADSVAKKVFHDLETGVVPWNEERVVTPIYSGFRKIPVNCMCKK